MTTEIVQNYELLVHHLPKLIEVSGYREDFLSTKLGLQPAAFDDKKTHASWTIDEMNLLLKIIDNEDVADYILLEMMEQTKDDEIMTAAEFRKEMKGWK